MPLVPTYKKQVTRQTPGVNTEAASPVRLQQAYVNNLTRTGQMLPSVLALGMEKSNFSDSGKNTAPKKAASDGMAPPEAWKNVVSLRAGLTEMAQKEVAKTGTLSASSLEAFAAKHFTPQDALGSAGRDYAVLYSAAHEAQKNAETSALKNTINAEASQVRRVGALVRTPQALDEYLAGQIDAYKQHLSAAGTDGDEAAARVEKLRADTVRDNILRALSTGDWQSASQTLAHHGTTLPQETRQACAAKTRAAYARSYSEKLWRAAEGSTPKEKLGSAQNRLREPDKDLSALIRRELEVLSLRAQKDLHRSAADTLFGLAAADGPSAQAALDGKDVFSGEDLQHVSEAVSRLDADAVQTDADVFMRLYGAADQADNRRAFKRGQVSARDFLRLEAARHHKQAGDWSSAERLSLGSVDAWMRKKGFSDGDIALAQYTVLSSSQPFVEAWKEIKNYLEV